MMSLLGPAIGPDGWIENVDLLPYFFRLTLDSATEFIFGESVESQLKLRPGYKSKSKMSDWDAKFVSAFEGGQRAIAARTRFMDMWWLYNTKEFRDNCKIVHDFVDHFVKLALSKGKSQEKSDSGEKRQYIFLDALAAETQDPTELRSELLHVLLAGRDTTASHLGWSACSYPHTHRQYLAHGMLNMFTVCYNLACDPVRYKKLRDAIIEDFGTYERPKEITFSKLKECKYLRYVNDESLRIYPVVPINARYANKDTTLPRGGGKDGNSPIFIPKGTSTDFSVHVMHRRKDIWGPDADEFKPERWDGRKVGWEYLPVSYSSLLTHHTLTSATAI